MGVSKQTFASAGKVSQHSKPGAYSRNESIPRAVGSVSASNLILLGSALGGEPNKIIKFTGSNEAKHTLKGGALLDGVALAFNPGDGLTPQQVWAMRVNPAVQASATLQKSAVDKIDLKTKDYGNLTNQTQYKLSAGTNTGKKFSEKYQDEEFIYDDIKRNSFTVQYTGDATTATITINGTQITTTLAGDQSDGSANLTVAFTSFPTIEEIVTYINGQTGYTAAVVAGQESAASNELDALTAVDIKTASTTIASDVQALIDKITAGVFFNATLSSGATRELPDNVLTYTFVTGGSEGILTNTEWTAALALLENEDIQLIGVMSEDAGVQTLLKTHVITTNGVTGKRERQAIVGSTASTKADAKTTAATMNLAEIGVAYKTFKNYDADGILQSFTSMHYAAQLLGQSAALDLNVPMTYKSLSDIENTTSDIPNIAVQEELIEAGVIIAETLPNGVVRTVRSITSYQKDDLKYNEWSSVRTMLFIARDVRTGAENRFIGTVGKQETYNDIEIFVVSKLNSYSTRGYLVGTQAEKSWKDLKLTINGDAINLEWQGNISVPNNFIFITNRFDILVTA